MLQGAYSDASTPNRRIAYGEEITHAAELTCSVQDIGVATRPETGAPQTFARNQISGCS